MCLALHLCVHEMALLTYGSESRPEAGGEVHSVAVQPLLPVKSDRDVAAAE